MALANFTLPFSGGIAATNWATVSPVQPQATAINNLLYNPAAHQASNGLPSNPQHPYYKNDPYAPPTPNRQYRSRNNYLPPPPPLPSSSQQFTTPQPIISYPQTQAPRPYSSNGQPIPAQDIQPPDGPPLYDFNAQRVTYDQSVTAMPLPQIRDENTASTPSTHGDGTYPEQRPVYTQVHAGAGGKTQVHAVLDYDNDNDEYYENEDENTSGKPGKQDSI